MRVDPRTGEILDHPATPVFRPTEGDDDAEDSQTVEHDPAEDLPIPRRYWAGVWWRRLAPVALVLAVTVIGIALFASPGPVVVAILVGLAFRAAHKLDGR